MTWAAWGLILDFVGVLLIATGTLGPRMKDNYLQMHRVISNSKIAAGANLLGWILLLVGFALQFVGEFH